MSEVVKRQDTNVVAADNGAIMDMISRVASDPNADIEKFERLLAMHERLEAKKAETEFNASMTAAQSDMGRVSADATNPNTRSKYASYGKLDRVLRPIYTQHGFALSFDTGEPPVPDYVRVVCYVSHRAGHSKTYHADMPADGKGAKGGDVMTKTHAAGSAMSYGMRYLLKLIFNVAVGEDDDDGIAAAKRRQEIEVDQKLLADMMAVADEGVEAYRRAWEALKPEQRKSLANHHAGFKERARKADGRSAA